MTVIFNKDIQTVKSTDVLYAIPETVKKLAAQMIVDTIEGNIDMIQDMPHEYPTKQSMEKLFSSAPELCLEVVEDYMEELRLRLVEAIKKSTVRARVVRIDYASNDDFSDIHVEVEVN